MAARWLCFYYHVSNSLFYFVLELSSCLLAIVKFVFKAEHLRQTPGEKPRWSHVITPNACVTYLPQPPASPCTTYSSPLSAAGIITGIAVRGVSETWWHLGKTTKQNFLPPTFSPSLSALHCLFCYICMALLLKCKVTFQPECDWQHKSHLIHSTLCQTMLKESNNSVLCHLIYTTVNPPCLYSSASLFICTIWSCSRRIDKIINHFLHDSLSTVLEIKYNIYDN